LAIGTGIKLAFNVLYNILSELITCLKVSRQIPHGSLIIMTSVLYIIIAYINEKIIKLSFEFILKDNMYLEMNATVCK
jgi:hypothetical protein